VFPYTSQVSLLNNNKINLPVLYEVMKMMSLTYTHSVYRVNRFKFSRRNSSRGTYIREKNNECQLRRHELIANKKNAGIISASRVR
jgi:hypothetical protein